VLSYAFILSAFNLYCLVNKLIQQPCHNSSHCDWRYNI